MTIGGSIALIVFGAILYFAMDAVWAGINMDVVGVILMFAGALGLLLSLFVWGPRRTASTYVADEHYHAH